MRVVGETRGVDVLGRLVIPSGFRDAMNIKQYDQMEITMEDWDGEKVLIVRHPPMEPDFMTHIRGLEKAAEAVEPSLRARYLDLIHEAKRALKV